MTQFSKNDDLTFDKKDRIISTFFIVFALIVFISQVLQFFHSRTIDRQYSEIISSKNIAIHATHSILIQSSTIQRTLFNLTVSKDSNELRNQRQKLLTAIQKNEADINSLKISFADANKDEQDLVQKILNANQEYKNKYNEYLTLISNKETKTDVLFDFRLHQLRPILDTYQNLQQDLLTALTNDFENQSDLLTEYNKKTGWTLLLFGLSPYIFIVLSLFYFILKLLGYSFFPKPGHQHK